jgi:osmotically-inducible protein OsmY
MKSLTLAGGFLTAALVATGCSDATREQAREAGQQVAEATRAAVKTVESAAQDVVASDVADATGAAAQTAKVKAALLADSSVTASGIDVDTDAASKTIVLKGRVPSMAQKTAAGRIAAEKASPGYSVRNELTVSGS